MKAYKPKQIEELLEKYRPEAAEYRPFEDWDPEESGYGEEN